MLKGFTRNFKPLEILTEEQVEAIHTATLDVLQETGVKMEHQRALKLLEKNGCKVDYDQMRVTFPPGLVEECLRNSPSSFRVKARDPRNDLIYGGNRTFFAPFPGMQTVDIGTWEPRLATRKEYADGVKVEDALDNLHQMLCYTPYFGFEGVPPVMALPESAAVRIRGSTKIMWEGYSQNSEIFTIQMAQATNQEFWGIVTASPPLTYYADACEAAFRYGEADMPYWLASGAVMGGTGPATIAGSTVTNNAELTAGLVLAQLIKPGARVAATNFVFPLNMRTGAPAFGAIGISLHIVVFAQLWRKYGIPTAVGAPGLSSSKKIDFQCGYEKAIPAFASVLSGVNVVQLHGGIFGELTHHPLQAILDDDIAGMLGHFIEGVTSTDETIALDLIESLGPIPSHYLGTAHTREWWKREQFLPKVADRLSYSQWIETGKKDCLDYAKERMEEILAAHKVSIPLTPSQEEDIEKILKEAREYYDKQGMISEAEWRVYNEKVLTATDL